MAKLRSSSRALYILEEIDRLTERIRHASEELTILRDVQVAAAPAFDRPRVSVSHNSDAMVGRLEAIERYESELSGNINRWIRMQRDADGLIASLDDPKQMSQGLTLADLSRMTSLPGRTLEEVEMGYSKYDHVKRVCNALGIKE